ncbi:uncharacterized protein YEL023C isoform X2 [Physcomitrium patens]|nr:uncharacterized protein YEL023C-like isoform X2 [Physcomitrium patens]XP_024399236.1 uncharacterized protein YEL023C-like isoform X2 [Physcomitrium patens]XP_024399237.1 uncharacterized protein YEL023C-like isoform X2 [Physcomitrium patens]|eukprot:XP_024399235.1 uncharacterized protein YEL023C-like isoform X2 [Physcomitrella patens]
MSSSFRRLVLLLDGTWQEQVNRTNVAILFENVDQDANGDGVEQIVKYFEGVGTSWGDRLLAGAFGYGLSEVIKDAYLWLSQTYKPGDEVFVFGFSRGAYTARSLVGLMNKIGGVLKQPTKALVEQAYDLYRDSKSDATEFKAQHSQEARVKLIGVWETVGALGIPSLGLPLTLPGTPDYYRFHDTNLSCIVDYAYHAIAIDEYRADFDATLWDATTEKNKDVEQCWFIGDHGNIGGGGTSNILSILPYVWMQDKAVAVGLRMKTMLKAGEQWRQAPNDSFGSFLFGMYRIYRLGQPNNREIGKKVEESLHPSVLLRLQNYPEYQPKPLTNVGVPDRTNEIPRNKNVKRCDGSKEGVAAS